MLWGIYSAVYGEVNVSVEKCVEIKGTVLENSKMLWGIYSAIYGEVNVSVVKCVEVKGDYVEK